MLVLALALVAADAGITLTLFEDGRFLDRPLPPFGAINHPRQQQWLDAQLAALDEEREPGAPGIFDAELGWTLAPSASSDDGRVRTSSAGARGVREYASAPPLGVTRVVCVGDSFTFCSEVEDADAWPARLELDAGLEALNFGCAGYGTDQALLRWRRDGRRWNARVACLGLLVENVGRNVNRYRPLYYPSSAACGAKPRFVLAEGELALVPLPFESRAALVGAIADGSVVTLLEEHEYWREPDLGVLRHSSLARLALGWRAYARRQPARLWRDTEGEPFRVTRALIEAFHREALESGAERALVLVFPREKELELVASQGEKSWQTLLDALAARGIPHLDLADTLVEPYRAEPGGFYAGGHLGPRANRIVAERIAAWIAAELAR